MSKKQTAMQQMIEFAKAHQELCNNNAKKCKEKVLKKQLEAGVTSYTFVIMEAKKLLELEKQNIIDFSEKYQNYIYKSSRTRGGSALPMDAEQYYNNTFNQ